MISFIIPAHNEEALLGRTLTAIHESAREAGLPYEIVVANDASTDRTGEIAAENGARVIAIDRRQIAAARNAGALASSGEILIFVDADTMITAPALRAAIERLQSGAAGGGAAVRFDAGPLPLYARMLQWLIPPALHLLRVAPGCFLFCTRAAYLAAGGFDETLFATEEVSFAQRLKQQGRFVILREPVITSARKLRTRSAWQLLCVGLRIARGGPRSLHQREGLDFWYGPRESPP